MKSKIALLLVLTAFAFAAGGCHGSEKAEKEIETEAEAVSATAPEVKVQEKPEKKEEPPIEEEEPEVKEEDIRSSELIQMPVQEGIKPEDTVAFVESDRREIMETRTEDSVVDEDDPDTYQIVQREEKAAVDEEIPEEYRDNLGNVVYEYADGVWYYYEYSSGDVALDEPDEEFALFLLNLDGSYDGYEIWSVECEEREDDGSGAIYEYHVLYRRAEKLTGEPEEVEGLTAGRMRTAPAEETVIVEEKVPVPVEKEVGTGTYTYFGWQNLDGDRYYFDGDGNKVTGPQIIQGIRFDFDSEGVLQSSIGMDVSERNGAIDWMKVRAAGVEYAMIRAGYRGCTEGTLIADSRFAEYMKGAAEAGIETGVYFFSQAVTEEEALEEAELVLEMLSGYSISMPVGIRTEYASDEYVTRTDLLSVQERTACVYAFCKRISDSGYTPVICGTRDWLGSSLDMSVLGGYPVWLSEYDINVTYSEPFMMCQYTVQGEVDGIGGSVNMDISYEK